jgi:hypothetical protein
MKKFRDTPKQFELRASGIMTQPGTTQVRCSYCDTLVLLSQ